MALADSGEQLCTTLTAYSLTFKLGTFHSKLVTTRMQLNYNNLILTTTYLWLHTCVPHILHPDISTCCKEQPLNWDEKEAYHIRSDSDPHKKHRKCLKKDIYMSKIGTILILNIKQSQGNLRFCADSTHLLATLLH